MSDDCPAVSSEASWRKLEQQRGKTQEILDLGPAADELPLGGLNIDCRDGGSALLTGLDMKTRHVEYDFHRITGFDWDAGKHRVSPEEAEEVFFRAPWVVEDTRPGDGESRFAAVGATEQGRTLRVLFTIRNHRIRPISCRPASRRERSHYEKALRERG